MSLNAFTPLAFSDYADNFAFFSNQLGESFARYGFAVVEAPDLDAKIIARFLQSYKDFFALPDAVKRTYHLAGGGGQRGYTPFGIETAKGATHSDLKEFWHVGRNLPADHPYRKIMPDNIWPTEITDLQSLSETLFLVFDDLGKKILQAIAVYLKVPRLFFEPTVEYGNSILRILHYPPVLGEVPNVRAGAHEDINVITLLLGAEEAGLQVKDRDGTWLSITPPPGCVVVNIGDMLQRLTNHVLPSTSHRVINPAPERARFARFSMPYFLHFNPDYEIRTLANCITPDNLNRYPDMVTANGYLRERLAEIKLA
jgi:isopenicillin N synthase-like dioxygenase